jgi:hypothetical protein
MKWLQWHREYGHHPLAIGWILLYLRRFYRFGSGHDDARLENGTGTFVQEIEARDGIEVNCANPNVTGRFKRDHPGSKPGPF